MAQHTLNLRRQVVNGGRQQAFQAMSGTFFLGEGGATVVRGIIQESRSLELGIPVVHRCFLVESALASSCRGRR
jgi:hypothetical protein